MSIKLDWPFVYLYSFLKTSFAFFQLWNENMPLYWNIEKHRRKLRLLQFCQKLNYITFYSRNKMFFKDVHDVKQV